MQCYLIVISQIGRLSSCQGIRSRTMAKKMAGAKSFAMKEWYILQDCFKFPAVTEKTPNKGLWNENNIAYFTINRNMANKGLSKRP